MANKRNLANVNVGASANDGTGDLLRDAFIKINDNFANIFGEGQFLANVTDNRGAPGYSWEDDKNTGLYNPEDGVIIVSLNGTDSLQMRSNGLISWRNEPLVTQTQLNTAIDNSTGGAGGNGLEIVENIPQTDNFDGRFILNLQDNLLYVYQDGAWVELKYKIQSGIDFVNALPPTAESYEGRTVIYDNAVWIYRGSAWVSLKNVADIEEDYSKMEVITESTLPTVNLFQGRTCWYQSELYIYVSGGWRKFSDYLNIQGGGGSVELAGSIKLWAGANAPDGWAICDGRAVSRTTYATLFSRVGTTYGVGDGSSTFNLPDFRGKTALGVSASYTLGATGGSADAVVVQHTHTSTITDPGHNHVPGDGTEDNTYNRAMRVRNPSAGTSVYVDGISYPQPDTITSGPIAPATTGITVGINNQGVSGAGRNLPPYVSVNWIIKLDDTGTAGTGGSGGTSGLFYTISIFRRSANTPPNPTGGSFDFGNLTTTPPATWYAEVPPGTDPVWMSRALAQGTTPTDVDSTLTWSNPVIVFRDGVTQTVTQSGDPGPRSSTGYIYYTVAATTVPAKPTASAYNFDTGEFGTLTPTGWSTSASVPTPEAGKKFYAVRYNVSEAQVYGGAQTVVISNPFVWQNFDGIVTFTNMNDAFDNNVTIIDGDKIDTGTLTADAIKAGTSGSTAEGSFGFGVGTEIYGVKATGYFKSSVDGNWPLIAVHDSGGLNDQSHGFAATTNALNSFGGTFYQFGDYSAQNSWVYGHAFLAGQKLGGIFTRYGDWTTVDRATQVSYAASTGAAPTSYAVENRFRSSVVLANNDYGVDSEWYDGALTSRTIPTYKTLLTGTTAGYLAGVISAGAAYPSQNSYQTFVTLADSLGYDLICYTGTAYIPGGVTTFTGVHEGVMESNASVELGDIVTDTEVIDRLNISNVRFKQILSSQVNQKGVIGVVSKIFTLEESENKRQEAIKRAETEYTREKKILGDTGERETDEQYETALVIEKENFAKLQKKIKENSQWIPPEGVHLVDVNAVGEGQINVCGEGGNIERGDLIVTSSIPGKGMKQADDIVRAYTVAKARESVTFASNTEVKTIACVYLCG